MESAETQERNQFTPRAPRFPIQAPLQFRVKGEGQWKEGQTVNISRSGVLFRASQLLAVRTPLEMTFELPAGLAEGPAATVTCQGEVVRTVMPAASDQGAETAATIQCYLMQRPAGPER